MTWTLVLVLAAIAYGVKVVGLVIVGGRSLPRVFERCLGLVPAALISALIVTDTFSTAGELVLDARAAGVGAAVVLAARRTPLILVIVAGATVTAAVRAVGWLP
jgi:branched-subunit amino acid transport protein